MIYTAKIEQTYTYPKRMKYLADFDTFIEKDCSSLSYDRNVKQPYGWIKESGTPPCKHLDVIIMTDREYELGDEDEVRIIGVFCRNDGDHKLVGVRKDRDINDFSELSDTEKENMHRLYPKEDAGEGWFGRERADEIITTYFQQKKRKIIITIQHAEAQHHLNGMIGGWGDWELTEHGREQAEELGEWLYKEGCAEGFHMITSDLKRAYQTAEGINKVLNLKPEVNSIIREVSAGAGNGTPREWYQANKIPKDDSYDPDYRPFPDAESDRDLWKRLYPFYQEITSNDMDKIILVSHGTTLSFLQSMLAGYSFHDIKRVRFRGCACAVTKFEIEPQGKVIMPYINHRVVK